jgi:hypothetical protein
MIFFFNYFDCTNEVEKVNLSLNLFFFFNNVILFIQMLATINTLKVKAPFGVSLLLIYLNRTENKVY